MWQGLPDRGDPARLDSVLGFQDVWRPLTLTPMRSWNALGSLVVPAAGLMLAVALRVSARVILRVIAGLGVLNGVLGLLQIATGKSSAFYFYELTNALRRHRELVYGTVLEEAPSAAESMVPGLP